MGNKTETSLKCLYTEDAVRAEEIINSYISFIGHPCQSFEQFKRDCDYYYSRILNEPLVAPTVIQFDYMRRCQLQCRICKIWSRHPTVVEEELTPLEIKALFDQAAGLGVSHCYFSGGEPFMLPYLFDVLNYAKSKNIFTEVTTNGILLNEENCKKVIDLPLNQINISIDGASAKTHDYHRNKPGLFNRVIKNVRRLAEIRRNRENSEYSYPIICMACVLTNKNFHEMLAYVKLANSIGVRAFFQPYASENDNYYRRTIEDEFVVPSERLGLLYKEIERVLEYKANCGQPYLISNTAESFRNLKAYFSNSLSKAAYCFAGFNRIVILKDRKINICPGEIGDFGKNTLSEIWHSKRAEELRGGTLNCQKPCLMGSAYYPGPSINDIFLIVKQYLLYLNKNKLYDYQSLGMIKTQLVSYSDKLSVKGLSEEQNHLELIFEYLDKELSKINP